jgi:multidrug resistance efflux pump
MSDPTTPYEIDPSPASIAVARAEAALAEAAAALEKARADEAVVLARIAAKRAARDDIVSRRVAGNERAEDGGQYALLSAELDRLADLLPPLQTAAAMAQSAYDTAAHQVTAAERYAKQSEAAHAGDLLEARLREIEGLYMKGVRELIGLRKAALDDYAARCANPRDLFAPGDDIKRFASTGFIA